MDNNTTKVLVGEVRLSYLHIFEPEQMANGGEKKYSVSLIIPKSNTELVAQIRRAIKAAYDAGIATRFNGKAPAAGTWRNPLRDGDVERPEDEAYADSYFLNASSKNQPGIVKVNPTGSPKYIAISDSAELFSGCFGYASVNFFAFNNAGNKGVGCGLNNVLKTRNGDFLGGRSTAESDFGGLELGGIPSDLPDGDVW